MNGAGVFANTSASHTSFYPGSQPGNVTPLLLRFSFLSSSIVEIVPTFKSYVTVGADGLSVSIFTQGSENDQRGELYLGTGCC